MRIERDKRYAVDPDETSKYVCFSDFQGLTQHCFVKNFSRSGIAFVMEDGSLILRIGDIISDMCFYSLDKEVHKSPATIIHIQDEEFEDGVVLSTVGCKFNDAMYDINAIIMGDKVSKLQNDFTDFTRSMALEDSMDPEFVNLTSHLLFLYTEFTEWLEHYENIIASESEADTRQMLTDALHQLCFESLFDEVNRYYERFTRITSRFTHSKQHFIHREFFQKRLMPYYLKSELYSRAFHKPLGYAGDFEMMNIIYRNSFEGENVFAQVMNKLQCEGCASRAVRNRRIFLTEKLQEAICDTPGKDNLKIVSVACGPVLEFHDLLTGLQGKKLPCPISFYGMDQDVQALDNARAQIETLIQDRKDIKAHFIEDNIKRLIIGKEPPEKEPYYGADLIYTAGLFDYLSDRAANRLILKLFSFLKPDGRLIIGNFGLYNPQRFIMEYGAEWFLIHRSDSELISLADGLPENTTISVEKEPEGINLFLNIHKKP